MTEENSKTMPRPKRKFFQQPHLTEAEKERMRVAKMMGSPPPYYFQRGRPEELAFANRGLSGPTILALLKHGLDMPERLLFMQKDEIKGIPGISKSGIREINAYRARFMGQVGSKIGLPRF